MELDASYLLTVGLEYHFLEFWTEVGQRNCLRDCLVLVYVLELHFEVLTNEGYRLWVFRRFQAFA